jgi:hypothetical protein
MNDECFFMTKNTYLHINSFIFKYMHWVWVIESDVRGGRGAGGHMSFHLHMVGPVQ